MKNFKKLRNQLDEMIVANTPRYTQEEAKAVIHAFGLENQHEWDDADRKEFIRQLTLGLNVEREHYDVTNGDLALTARIALAHIEEFNGYYDALAEMEKKLKKANKKKAAKK